MNSDSAQRPAGRPFRHPGPGLSQQFRCPGCNRNRQMIGRKLRRFAGLRTWICAECVKPKGTTCETT